MPSIKLSALVLLLLLFFTAKTPAWDSIVCAPPRGSFSPYWSSATVFTGQVESIETSDREMVAKFTVEKVYRGALGNQVDIRTEVRHGYFFQKDERYFVYSGMKGKDGRLYVDMCSPTRSLASAGEDIEFAEDVAAGKRGTRIHGWVFEYRPKLWTLRNNEPAAGIKVTIKGPDGRESTTVTDEKGRYVFKELADGAYEVRAETPAGTHEVKRPRNYLRDDRVYIGNGPPDNILSRSPFYRHWDGKSFMFTSAGSVRVRIGTVNGKPVPRQSVELLAIDDKGKAQSSYTYPDFGDLKRGEFVFDLVAPGKYLVAINPNGCHTPANIQLGRLFYPGVANEENARVITVRENEVVSLKEVFKPPPPLKERWMSGVVQLPDGTPVANATVFKFQKGIIFSTCVSTQSEVQTDAAGRFRLKGYEPYEYFIRAYIQIGSEIPRKRLISAAAEIPPGNGPDDLRLTLYPEN